MTLPQRVSLSITGTFNFFCASFCSSCLTIEYSSCHCGLPWMYLTTLCSLPTAPNDLHFFFAYSHFSSSVTPVATGYSSSSFTLGPKSRPLTAICISWVKQRSRHFSGSNPLYPSLHKC